MPARRPPKQPATAVPAAEPATPTTSSAATIPRAAAAGPAPGAPPPPSPRGAATRAAIIDAALSLFEERGYDDTTMRAVAERAGVSVGNAYYYFASKEHLIQGFYDRAGRAHRARAVAVLDAERALDRRLIGVLEAWIDEMARYRSFAAGFFRNASDPDSPLSPFSASSAPARDAAVELLAQTVTGSTTKPPKAVQAELPELLWLFQMGVVLFWVHDRSDDCIRTRTLVRRTVPLVVRAIELARLPVLRGVVTDLVALIEDLRAI